MPIHPPIIVIGMHRSGTSLLTRMLGRLGLFIGAQRDPNDEAIFFQRENDWLLRRAGARWDNPQSIKALSLQQDLHDLCCRRLARRVRSPQVSRYLGVRRYLSYRSIVGLDFAWGWKDPCNTYTLPLWLHLYPEAKVVHIHRHGVDVAQSLAKREMERPAPSWATVTRRRVLSCIRGYSGRDARSTLCRTLEGAFDLWEKYMVEARHHVAELGPRAFELSYEQLLETPRKNLRLLSQFCNLPADEDMLDETAGMVSQPRAKIIGQDDRLIAFAQSVTDRLANYGY